MFRIYIMPMIPANSDEMNPSMYPVNNRNPGVVPSTLSERGRAIPKREFVPNSGSTLSTGIPYTATEIETKTNGGRRRRRSVKSRKTRKTRKSRKTRHHRKH